MGSQNDKPEGWTPLMDLAVQMAGPSAEKMRAGLENALASGFEQNRMMVCPVCGAVEEVTPAGRSILPCDYEIHNNRNSAESTVLKKPRRTRDDLDDDNLDKFNYRKNRGGHD